ncbi:hypothetical protein GCM10009830_19610 [Glycomyces endophyticus]|uniref:Uncharacterized protein n=1 Tax=Glycomyces endophyticus TaxID=480996 RepID=A0ABN2GNB7_9ACTN
MNPDDMRRLFDHALDGATPVPASSTDETVAAGKRLVRRRRAATGAGAAAAIAALAAAAATPLALPDRTQSTDPAGPEAYSCEAYGDQSDAQTAVGSMYDQAVDTAMAAIGATLVSYCGEDESEHGGFYFDAEADGYRYQALAFFDSEEQAILRVDVLEPNAVAAPLRMENLAGCGGPDVGCAWEEAAVPLLVVQKTRTAAADDAEGDQVPVLGALAELEDGVIVHIELEEAYGTGALSTTTEQLAEVALAIPVGQDPPDSEGAGGYTLPADADLVQAFVDGIAEQYPGAEVAAASEIAFTAQEETEAYAEGYHYGNDGTRVAYADATVDGERVRFFLQLTPIDAPEDGGATQEPAEHYANCLQFECEYTQLDASTGLVHRDSVTVRPGPTSIEHRAADGWVVGVGAESRGSTEAPSIDFDALDAIVHTVR